MASKRTPETNAMPHLIVKIVGSKQVKYFVEGPNKEEALNNEETEQVHTPIDISPGEPSVDTSILPSGSLCLEKGLNEDARIHRELQQIRDRQCVTAPCGDRSLSYIHLKKSPSAVTDLRKAAQQQPVSGGHEEGELKDGEPVTRLVQAVREELRGWGGSPLKNIERDVLELDASLTGTIDQSLLTYVFLRNEVPLKLPTLGHLLSAFSEETCPDEVQYRELLHFLSDTATDDQKKMKTDESSQPGSRTSVSVHSDQRGPSTNMRTSESWVVRFQEMERAMELCDTHNTGLLDKDKARRLIQNYNVILDLNLSPLKIAEATHSVHSEGKIHLASALRYLKGL